MRENFQSPPSLSDVTIKSTQQARVSQKECMQTKITQK